MKRLKKIFFTIFLLFAIIAVGIFGYTKYKKPNYEGQIAIQNINKKTNVYFDDFGIPHIYANSQKDAMTVLGYVHAQDRLWQMELMRRIAPGRLSELFGNKMLQTDKFFAGIGIDENSQKTIETLDKNSEYYKLSIAYLDGVNQFIVNGKTPLEFDLVGVQKEKYTLKDIHNIFGYMAFSFAMAQKTDPLLTDIRDQFGAEYLTDLGIDGSFGTTQLKNYKGKSNDFAQISTAVSTLLDHSPIPSFIGSNSWVIGAPKTKNGKVIFANDPHIMFSQPCTWYEAHISCPDYEIYGYYLAGTPFPLLGHNREYAYGLTMFENDDLDLFQEVENALNSNQYKTKDGFNDYTIRTKTIKVKDSTSVTLNIKETNHGPILNKLLSTLTSTKPVSFSWIYTQENNQTLKAIYKLCHAKNVNDFYQNVELIHAPGLNIMYGDAKNNIAWITSGKLYKLDSNINPNFILNGSNGIDDKKTFLPYSKNPSAINPPCNYVYSANNQTQAIDGYLYPGYYLPEDRAKRIESLVAPKTDWTSKNVQQMLLDDTSSISPQIVTSILQNLSLNDLSNLEKKSFEILAKWDGSNNGNKIAPTIYNKIIYHYLKNTFQDELGSQNFNTFLGTHIMKQTIAHQIKNTNSPWWDNIKTKDQKETQKEILSKSFKEAIANLEIQLGNDILTWNWKKVHTLEHAHPLGKVEALKSYFDVGPFEISGSNEVINNMMFSYVENGKYEVKGGPSTRRVIDFSDIENSMSIIPTGQSGVPTSPHYSDQAQLYNDGKFRKMKLNKKEIIATSTKLIFVPK